MNKRNLAAVLLALPALPATAGDLTLGGGMDFSSGKYGTSQSTDIWYAPLTTKYETGAATFKLSIPYVRIRAAAGGKLIGVDAQGHPIYDGTGTKNSEEGIGDVVASFSYSLFEQPVNGLLLDLSAKAKLGTADVAKGLGTGENDYTALADLYYLAGAWTPFASVSYRLTGDPAGSDLKNVWGGSLGLGYKRSATDSLGLMWDSRQASTTTGVASNEVTAYWVHKFSSGMKLQTYMVKGFSDGSADWGIGAMLSKAFNAR